MKKIIFFVLLAVSLSLSIVAFAKIWKRSPQPNPEIILERMDQVKSLIEQGQLDQARIILEKNISALPDHEESLMWLSHIYLQLGQAEEAFEYGKKLYEISSDAPRLTNLGSMFASKGYEDMAFASYVKAQKSDNHYPEVYIELGKLYGNQEIFDRAIAVWQDGLSVAPNDGRFNELIAQAMSIRKQIEAQKAK